MNVKEKRTARYNARMRARNTPVKRRVSDIGGSRMGDGLKPDHVPRAIDIVKFQADIRSPWTRVVEAIRRDHVH